MSRRSSRSAAHTVDGAASSLAAAQSWISARGEKRIVKELHYTLSIIEAGTLPQISHLVNYNDHIDLWRFRVSNFDEDRQSGRDINSDLRACGQPYIQMEARFPKDYPTEPFFLRIITPRMKWYTGHVTAGGSICIEALVNTGSPNGWQPSYTFESIISLVLCNMIDCETNVVKTVSGPGGVSGPLRVDLRGEYHGGPQSVMREYGESEAQAAYSRMVDNHKRLGWTTDPPPAPSPAAGGASSSAKRVQPPSFVSSVLTIATSGNNKMDAVFLGKDPAAVLSMNNTHGLRKRRDRSSRWEPQPSIIAQDLTNDSDGEGEREREGAGRRVRKRVKQDPASSKKVTESITILDSQDDDILLVDHPSSAPAPPLAPSNQTASTSAAQPHAPPLVPLAAMPSKRSRIIEDEDDEIMIVGVTMGNDPKGSESMGDLQRKIQQLERRNHLKDAELERTKRAAEAAAEAATPLVSTHMDGGAGPFPIIRGTACPLVPPRVPPPGHWEPFLPNHPEGAPLFVQLPMIFDDNELDPDVGEEEAPAVNESLVAELVGNGIYPNDAREALEHCLGDMSLACEFVFNAANRGGASLVLQKIKEERVKEAMAEKMAAKAGGRAITAAQRAQAEAEALLDQQRRSKMAAIKAEVDLIATLFSESSTLSQTYVIVAIERVQNRQLYTDYSLRKAKLETQISASDPNARFNQAVASGHLPSSSRYMAHMAAMQAIPEGRRRGEGKGPSNEKLLWHGSSLEIIKTVCSEGFDFRVSNQAGALGMGTYYSEDAYYSSQYSMRHQASSAALLMAQRAAGKVVAPAQMPSVLQALQIQSQALQAQAQAMMTSAIPAFPPPLQRKRGRHMRSYGAPQSLPPPPPPPAELSSLATFDTYQSQPLAAPPRPCPQRIIASPNPTFKGHTMLLCAVALGRTAAGSGGLRRPPPGYDAVHGPSGFPNSQNYAIFDNSQAYPQYLVHFGPK